MLNINAPHSNTTNKADLIVTHQFIPKDAFRYFPKAQEQKTPDGIRRIFDGNTKFDETENKIVKDFKVYCEKQKYQLSKIWDDNKIVRFLQANSWKLDKTLVSIKEHEVWRESRLPAKLTPPVQEFLSQGIMYLHGRDHKCRPIVVFNMWMIDLKTVTAYIPTELTFQKIDLEKVIDAITYFIEFILSEVMLPGQVENWVFILDLNKKGLMSLPLAPLKKIITYLQKNYRGYLWTMFIVNAPSSITIPWGMVKGFMHEVTAQKVQFSRTGVHQALLDSANADQVELKYGGTAPNLSVYWPSSNVSNNCLPIGQKTETVLVTPAQYYQMYESGLLQGNYIDYELINKESGQHKTLQTNTLQNELTPNQQISSLSNPTEIKSAVISDLTSNTETEHKPRITPGKTEEDNCCQPNVVRSISKDDMDLPEYDHCTRHMDEAVTIRIHHVDISILTNRYFEKKKEYFKAGMGLNSPTVYSA